MPDDARHATPPAFPVEIRFSVHWAEMDALGHVNNARYFTWFESARMALFERLGLDTSGVPEVGPILAHTSCDFLAPVTYPAEIAAGTRIARLGSTSFTMEYGVTLLSSEPPRQVARGGGVVVLIDYRSGQKVRIPPDLREGLEALT